MEAIVDSSFILSCVRKKINFAEQLRDLGFKPIVPREVLQELKDIKTRAGESHEDREGIELAFKIIEKSKIKKMSLGKTDKVDFGLIKLGKKGIYIATLDKGILRSIPNRITIKSAEKKIIVERE